MKKTLRTSYSNRSPKVTIESTGKKLYGTMIWADKDGNYYAVERKTCLGHTYEAAKKYTLSKEEFDSI